MIRVDIETIIMAAGPVPSVIVLRERSSESETGAPLRSLSIQTGSYEAASVSHGIDAGHKGRPITADLMLEAIRSLGGKIERVEINRAEPPVFFANVVLIAADGTEVAVDARPSDALALAVRSNAPMFVEDELMNRLGTVSLQHEETDENELEKFDEFVQTLSPDDF